MRRLKALILKLLNEHRVMTMATNRPDGWPQATMVGYVNDNFLLYCFVARNAQKYPTSCAIRGSRFRLAVTCGGLWTSKGFRLPEKHPRSPTNGSSITSAGCG